MIAQLGHAALWVALALSLVQMWCGFRGAAAHHGGLIHMASRCGTMTGALCAISFFALMYAYITSDFSLLNVAMNSHTDKPMLYKISGTWGNHEGSMLLWVLILTLAGAAVAGFGQNLPPAFRARVLGVQAFLGLGFLAFLLLTSNPFERLETVPLQGQGLNPLLQDPGLAFHPPFLYLGYVGFSIAFSFAIAALIEGRITPAWARWVRPWTLAAWGLLTIGIGLGSWWAYYELGWGGWWFWDPVENASFMPWLAGTALIHSVAVLEKRDAFKAWTVLLAILTFSLSLLGTFLVRSGILTSVHAFAVDPERGLYILAFLALVVGGAFALFALRAGALRATGAYRLFSREGGLMANNLLAATGLATVLVGTLYPLLLDATTGQKISVGPPFFEATFVPLAMLLVLIMGAGPLMSWKRADGPGLLQRLQFAGILACIAALAGWAFAPATGIDAEVPLGALAGLALSVWVLLSLATDIAAKLRVFDGGPIRAIFSRLLRQPQRYWGMILSHAGVAIVMLAITLSATWEVEVLDRLSIGESAQVGAYSFTLTGVEPVMGANYSAVRAHFDVDRHGADVAILSPETRTYSAPPMETTEAAILPLIGGDLFAVVGDAGEGGWSVRLYTRPLMSWLWAGCLMIAFGGFLALAGRRRASVSAPSQAPAAAAA
ncbi:MAG: heme lyase CcmF/NrfE family subunit [Pseudomonadota bacterium]